MHWKETFKNYLVSGDYRRIADIIPTLGYGTIKAFFSKNGVKLDNEGKSEARIKNATLQVIKERQRKTSEFLKNYK